MLRYDKDEIKEKLDIDKVFDIIHDFGGEPRRTDFGFIAATICHNVAGCGSHKLYYYENTQLFRCYTGCDKTFDIFELIRKIKLLSNPESSWNLYDSIRWVAARYGWGPTLEEDDGLAQLPNLSILERYDKISEIEYSPVAEIQLKEYDRKILNLFPHLPVWDWVQEGIKPAIMKRNEIGYYPVTEQITIPHFDIHGRFIGLRGRALGDLEARLYGKYRPMMIGAQLYNHALGLNLYNINNSHENIKRTKIAIVYEGEKSCLLHQSYFGIDNDISVACCGSALSDYQMQLLLNLDVNEVIIAFDRQFQKLGDDEFKHLTRNLENIHNRFKNYVKVSFIFDSKYKLPYKAAPIDCGPDLFMELYKNRIFL